MLFENDILNSKNITIDVVKKTIFIDNIDVIISLKTRSTKSVVQRLVHLRKTIIVSSHTKMTISINHFSLSIIKNFFFESNNDLSIFMYVHIIDVDINVIIIRNVKNVSIKILKNYRLNRISKIDFLNAFHIDNVNEKMRDLTLKHSKITHKNDWFKKLIFVCVIVYVVVVVVNCVIVIISILITTFLITIFLTIFFVVVMFVVFVMFVVVVVFVVVDVSILQKFFVIIDARKLFFTRVRKSFVNEIEKFFANFSISTKIVMSNEIIIYNFETIDFFVKIMNDFLVFWHDIDFVELSKKNWMRIFLKFDWKTKVFEKIKIYSLKIKNRELINKIFDEFHDVNKMNWINQFTSFFYSIFCVWKTMKKKRKSRVVIDIKNLNNITQFDAYFFSLQSNMIVLIRKCSFIFVIDCFNFFYQWRVHLNDRHKFTIVNYRDQKSFNVVVMNYKNSSTYVQRQINRFLRLQRRFVKIYVNDIVIFFKTKKKHEKHLREIFEILTKNNISIKSTKIFINYSSISLLSQKVDFFDFVTAKEKLKTIIKLRFFHTFRQLKIYLKFIDWMRDYIIHYVDIFKSLQNKKTKLLRHESIVDNARRAYSSKIRVFNSTKAKLKSFRIFQKLLFMFFFLIHVNIKRQLFIDLNVNKKFDIKIMLYYVKKIYFQNFKLEIFFSKYVIKSILFLNRFISSTKFKYWSTKLKIIDIVWVFKKTRHIVEISSNKTIIYIDHEIVFNIII